MCRRQMCSNRQCGVSLVRPFGIGYPDSDRPPAAEIPPKPIALYGDSATCSATEDIERVETFAGRASPRGLVILASAVEQRRTGLGPNFVARPWPCRVPTPTRLCGCEK